jgi:hypothetical protein
MLCLSVEADKMGISAQPPIVGLLFRGGPSAVARLVVPIVVREPINTHAGRALTHIGKEIRERFKPSHANRNAASAVIRICWIVGIGATGKHMIPTMESACASARGRSVRRV